MSESAVATCGPVLAYASANLGEGGRRGGVENRMGHPLWNYVGVGLTFTLTGLIFGTGLFRGIEVIFNTLIEPFFSNLIEPFLGIEVFDTGRLNANDHFYVPIVLLIAFYTVVAITTDRQVYEKRSGWRAFGKAVPKFVFWGLVVLGVYGFYWVHPAYAKVTPHTRVFVWHFFWAYVFFGLPYFYLEEKYRYCRDNVLGDPYVRLVILLKRLARGEWGVMWRRLISRRNRRTLLTWMIRIHYIPVMVEQVHYGIGLLDWTNLFQDGRLAQVTFVIGTLAWLIDSNNASIGYFWQSSFTKTRFREPDPHPSHWVIVLACYTPFIYFVNDYFAEFPALAENSTRLFASVAVNRAIDLTILGALVCYMLSGTALGFSYSNLCYKKIQTRGPYGLVRHPATACKILYFTLVFFRYRDAFRYDWMACWVFWMSIYIGRALVEERFLKRFPEYRAYMKKTRYRFFPGIA